MASALPEAGLLLPELLGVVLAQSNALGPESCILSGLCPPAGATRLHSGIMFTAVGLVALGLWRWRRQRRAVRGLDPPKPPGLARPE